MTRFNRIIAFAGLLALSPAISACSNFDPDKLDIFGLSEEKKLEGVRKPLFPGGVPGVTQGVPPELVKGTQARQQELQQQQQLDPAQTAPAGDGQAVANPPPAQNPATPSQ